MRKPNSKAVRITALATAAAFALLPMATAAAATANASAFGVQVKLLGIATVGPTPTSSLPAGGNNTLATVNIPGIGDVNALFANTSGDAAAGTSSASAGAATLGLLGTVATGFAISADAVSSQCTANGTTTSGSTTVANLKLGTNTALNLTAVQQQTVVNIPNVGSVLIGEQIQNPDGSLTVNALHINLLPTVGGGADIIIGSSTCGPNVPVAGVAAFSFQDLPLILGALALIVVIGFGIRTGVRRLGSAA